MIEISFKGRARGPIEDGREERWVREYNEDVAHALAEDAKDIWVRNLEGSIRNPTPYYWTRIDERPIAYNRWEIWDHDIVYGPWLEGTGSRNETTIFKGYWAMARAKEMTKRRRSGVARRILRRYRSEGKLI